MAKAAFVIELDTDGDVDLRGTGVTKLPDNLTVGDDLYLEGTGITELPGNLKVGEKALAGVTVLSGVGFRSPHHGCQG